MGKLDTIFTFVEGDTDLVTNLLDDEAPDILASADLRRHDTGNVPRGGGLGLPALEIEPAEVLEHTRIRFVGQYDRLEHEIEVGE